MILPVEPQPDPRIEARRALLRAGLYLVPTIVGTFAVARTAGAHSCPPHGCIPANCDPHQSPGKPPKPPKPPK